MADEIADLNVVMQCDHCGNRTTFTLRAEYTHVEREDSIGLPEYNYTIWRVMQCLKCLKPTLLQTYKVSNRNLNSSVPVPKSDILYPAEKIPLSDLPITIERAYLAALKVRYEPNAFAVLAGRTLEVVCNHENVSGRVFVSAKARQIGRFWSYPFTSSSNGPANKATS